MKIAYCIPGLHNPGGMERVLTLKANFLVTYGYEVHVLLTDGIGKPFAFPLEPSVIVHQLDIDFEEPYHYPFIYRIWLYNRKMRMLKRALNRCLCEIKPDITVSMLRRDINVINRMTDGSLKVGEIHFDRLHYRTFSAPGWLPHILYAYIKKRWMEGLIKELRRLACFVVLTHEDAVCWPELERVEMIPDPASFFPDEASDCSHKQIIAVGRYVRQKGFDRLIKAWKMVAVEHPDWVLKIYGDGGMRDQLQRLVEESGLSGKCLLEHTVSDIDRKMKESAIFVLSSRFEGFGLVIVEAMACGLPVVSFACPCGPRDIISDGVDGFLVEDGDCKGLAEAINRLIEDRDLRCSMGKNARLKAEQYTIEKIGRQWMDLFESLLANKK